MSERFDAILANGRLRTLFQPIVDLATRVPIGFEALVRGPEGPYERPDQLFGAAHEHQAVAELDVLCQVTAISTAITEGLEHPHWLFLNAEPETLARTSRRLIDAYGQATRATLPLVIEVTERSVTAQPAELLQSLDHVRAAGVRIAMDDVGADSRALALLPLLRPDVIKLDLELVQRQPSRAIARIVTAVNAEAERSGAEILAEGIETEEHLDIARSLGATLGQGWLFGHPDTLPVRPRTAPTRALRPVDPLAAPSATPFEVCAAGLEVRTGRKALLIEMSKHLEAEAAAAGEVGVLLSTFQHARHFTPNTERRYAALADDLAFVAAIGEDLPVDPVAGVRGTHLHPDDPLCGEWTVVAVGPHFVAALTAKDLGEAGPDRDRRFEFVVTYDRDRVLAAARSLLERVWADARPIAPRPLPPTAILEQLGSHAAAFASLLEGPSTLHLHALAAATNGITIADALDPELPLVYVNEGFERLTGYPAADIIGRNCRFLQGPGTDEAAVRRFGEILHHDGGGKIRLLNYRADGTPWWNEVSISTVHNDEGVLTHYIGIQADVTAEVEAERRLGHLVFHDELTGLPNRRALADELDAAIMAAGDDRGTALLFLTLDGLRAVNGTHGSKAGDEVLRWVAERVRSTVRARDLVARHHSNEFVIVLRDLVGNTAGAAARTADAVLAALRREAPLPHGDSATITASIGIAFAPADGDTPDQLLAAGNRAAADAKGGDPGAVAFASAPAKGVASG